MSELATVVSVGREALEAAERQDIIGKAYTTAASLVATLTTFAGFDSTTPLATARRVLHSFMLPDAWPAAASTWIAERAGELSSFTWVVFTAALVCCGGIRAPLRRAHLTLWVAAALLVQTGSNALLLATLVVVRLGVERLLESLEWDVYPEKFASVGATLAAIVMLPFLVPLVVLNWLLGEPASGSEKEGS